jgi:hypothetical protein
MERGEWQNLNGIWNYANLSGWKTKTANFERQILVQFAVETSSRSTKKGGSDNSYVSRDLPYL